MKLLELRWFGARLRLEANYRTVNWDFRPYPYGDHCSIVRIVRKVFNHDMKPSPVAPKTMRYGGYLRRRVAGATLVEVMIAMLVFTMVSIGIATSLIQLRRAGEDNISQVLAQSTAEGLLEQIRRTSFTDLSDTTNNPPVELLFINVNANNRATVETVVRDWDIDPDASLSEIGVHSDPTDPTTLLGILLDVDNRDSSGNIIRPRRYMKMRMNLSRSLNANKDAVQVCLKFQWSVPDGRGNQVFRGVREIRTVISKMPTY